MRSRLRSRGTRPRAARFPPFARRLAPFRQAQDVVSEVERRDGSPTRTPPYAAPFDFAQGALSDSRTALGPRRRASPGKLRDACRVPPLDACSGRPEHRRRAGSTADCSAWLADDAVAPAAQHGKHARAPRPRRGAVPPPPRACGAAGRGRGTRGAERRLPRRSAPAGPRRGRTARVCGGEPSRQPASRSGRRARAADGCPGGGAGSRGGGTAPATRADRPVSRRQMPSVSSPRPDTRE